MKIVLIIVGTLVGIGVVVVVVGSVLPKSHVASRMARYHAAPEAIWSTLSDFERYPDWAPEITSVTRLADRDGHPVWEHAGPKWKMPMAVTAFDPPRAMTLEIASNDLPYSGTWSYVVAPDKGETIVTVTERGEVANPIFRFMSRFVFGQTRTMDAYLEALGRRHGESVTPATASGS